LAPKYSQAHYQLGRVYFVEGKLDRAISEFNMTLRVNSEHKRAYYMRGLAKGYKEDYVGAQADFHSFVDNFPDEWAGYVDLAWVYYEDEKYDKAREVAEKGVELFPENAWVLKGLGVAYIQLGEKEKAREVLEKAGSEAEKLTVSDWRLAYPGNDPSGAETNLAIFKSDIQEAIFSSKSVLAMERPRYTSACSASSINICSGATCTPWAYCDGDSIYHNPYNYFGVLVQPDILCSYLLPSIPSTRCYSDADCCTPNCSYGAYYCIGATYDNGCGGTCPGTVNCTPSTVSVSAVPNPVAYSGVSHISFNSTGAIYCQVWLDSNLIVNGFVTSGFRDIGPMMVAGPHLVGAVCYNSSWAPSVAAYDGFMVNPPPIINIAVLPVPVPYNGNPAIILNSAFTRDCGVYLDWTTELLPLFTLQTAGTFYPGAMTVPGLHEVEVYCRNAVGYSPGWRTFPFAVRPPPTVSIGVAPPVVPYNVIPAISLASTDSTFCYLGVDDAWTNGWLSIGPTAGTFYPPSILSTGTHVAWAYCYNSVWYGTGWVPKSFVVDPPPCIPGAWTPDSATECPSVNVTQSNGCATQVVPGTKLPNYGCLPPDCTGKCEQVQRTCTPICGYDCSVNPCGFDSCTDSCDKASWKEVAP
jgi:tetratricopeptide (TPR) repeat protein